MTVAAVIEREGRFLLVEEHTSDGLRINQPAGHLEYGESLEQAAVRETLEETAHDFTPTALLGLYLLPGPDAKSSTFLRVAFRGELGLHHTERNLDPDIVRTLWLTRDEILARQSSMRSPLVLRCVEDYLAGRSAPLDLLRFTPLADAPFSPLPRSAR